MSELQEIMSDALTQVHHKSDLNIPGEQYINTSLTHPNPTTQKMLSSKILEHSPDSGLNSIVDTGAYIFSMMGRIKHLKSCVSLNQLHTDLVFALENFKIEMQSKHYNTKYIAEYIPIACYALCLTLDDIISTASWGNQGRWEAYSLVARFDQESLSRNSFFIILERLVRDPDVYIDLMEFMYICLSMGFKCQYNNKDADFNNEQLEQISDALYKRIRTARGSFNKILSPYLVKPRYQKNISIFKAVPLWLTVTVSASLAVILCMFVRLFVS